MSVQFRHQGFLGQFSLVAAIAAGLAAAIYWINSLTRPDVSVPAVLASVTGGSESGASTPSAFHGTRWVGQYIATGVPMDVRSLARADLVVTLLVLVALFVSIHVQARRARAGAGPLWILAPGAPARWLAGSLVALGILPQFAERLVVLAVVALGDDSSVVRPSPFTLDLGWIVAGIAYYALVLAARRSWMAPEARIAAEVAHGE